MKRGPGAPSTTQNEFRSANHENLTRCPRFRPKRVREQNMKTGPDELGVVENESSNAKHENWTWRPKYRRK
jgi:hypothetical protein